MSEPSEETTPVEQIEMALQGVPVDRTRPSSRLKKPEVARIMDLIRPVVEALETALQEARAREITVPEGPLWYGITFPQERDVLTADKKNAVYLQFLEREELTGDMENNVLGTSIKDNETGKRVYYYYTVATPRGPLFFYVVHRDYLDRLPIEILEFAGLVEPSAPSPEESEETEQDEDQEDEE